MTRIRIPDKDKDKDKDEDWEKAHTFLATTMLLAIDTSTPSASLALFDGFAWHEAHSAAESHDEELLRLTKSLVDPVGGAGLIKSIVIGTGPGSFTGLRIGYGFVKGLSLGLSVPVNQISTEMGRVFQYRTQYKLLYSVVSAGRGELFCAAYKSNKGRLLPLFEGEIYAHSKLLTEIANQKKCNQFEDGDIVLIGNCNELNLQPYTVQPTLSLARSLGEIFIEKGLQNPDFRVSALAELSPRYIRAVAAKTIIEREGLDNRGNLN